MLSIVTQKNIIRYPKHHLSVPESNATTGIWMATISTDFLSAGGNRHPSAADWDTSGSGLLAFGSNRNVALWDPLNEHHTGVVDLLPGHAESVNAVRFYPQAKSLPLLLSGSTDGTIILWSKNEKHYTSAVVLKDHRKAINVIDVLPALDIFVSGSADAELKIWKIEPAPDASYEVKLLQTIALKPKFFPLALCISALSPDTKHAVFAVAGTRSFVQIYSSQYQHDTISFQHAATLTGHEGWIRSLSVVCEDATGGDLLLASTSQDKYIRLWRIHEGDTLPAMNGASADPALGMVGRSLSNKAHRFVVENTNYSATFEALLLGHEDWIFSSRWCLKDKKPTLLSASADNSLAIWELDTVSGVWVCTVRLGEINAQKGATTATGSTGGFWVGLWSPDGETVVSLGRTGGWRLWRHEPISGRWQQELAITGHTREVQDLAWAADGSYLLTTSADQTTRLYAEWKRDGKVSWHEFSRPQIHGYDLNCIDTVRQSQFITGADEKLLRVFDEPKAVAQSLAALCGIVPSIETAALPDIANIPVLGLSNKAVNATSLDSPAPDVDDNADVESDKQTSSTQSTPTAPPTEDTLSRHLLWPESEKLYGHGYEISAVAATNSPCGTNGFVATACRASSIDHAVIRLYSTMTWRAVGQSLAAHSLTVTRLAFSPDDQYLLSVGRDRQCAIFARDTTQSNTASDDNGFALLAAEPKAHTRMVLDAAWAPKRPGQAAAFATAGRDKMLQVWQIREASLVRVAAVAAGGPVTAVAFLPRMVNGAVILAYGLENGSIAVLRLSGEDLQVQETASVIDKCEAPARAVMRLAWRPGEHGAQLAAASEDCSVRIYGVQL